jgi:hypothetical protein
MWAPIIPVSSMEPSDMLAFYKREKRWWLAQIDLYKEIKLKSAFNTPKGRVNNLSFFNELNCFNLYTTSFITLLSIIIFTSGFALLPMHTNEFNVLNMWLISLYASLSVMFITIICTGIITKSFWYAFKLMIGMIIYMSVVWCVAWQFLFRLIYQRGKIKFYVWDKNTIKISFKDFLKFNKWFLILFHLLLSIGLFFIISSSYIDFHFNIVSIGVMLIIQSVFCLILILSVPLANILSKKNDIYTYQPLYNYDKYRKKYGVPKPINLPVKDQ